MGEPFAPRGEFGGIGVGRVALPETARVRKAGLVDKIEAEEGHVLEARGDGFDPGALIVDGGGIGVGVAAGAETATVLTRAGALDGLRLEGKEREDDLHVVTGRGLKKGLDRSQKALAGGVGVVFEIA